ncbi:MAG: PIN domain-containing protein [Paludibacteraceae bacterium]|nr:PIN domain-containing protein [Paludibacteraceae bacterium]
MNKFLLDTDICIAVIKGHPCVIEHIYDKGQECCCVSEITIAELYYGAAKSGKQNHYSDIRKIEELFDVLPLGYSLPLYGKIRAELESQGNRLDNFDLLIAATALQENITLVTGNEKHFNRIQGLNIQNWMK